LPKDISLHVKIWKQREAAKVCQPMICGNSLVGLHHKTLPLAKPYTYE